MGKVDIVTYLGSCVTEDDGLRYGEGVVKVAQRVKNFNSDEERGGACLGGRASRLVMQSLQR
jgi:hypothetical protein